jgi:hypothetical protein
MSARSAVSPVGRAFSSVDLAKVFVLMIRSTSRFPPGHWAEKLAPLCTSLVEDPRCAKEGYNH